MKRPVIASCVVAAAFVAVAASAALAVGPTGSLTETLNVGVRSVTVARPRSRCAPTPG
jgi:hypothetical protein